MKHPIPSRPDAHPCPTMVFDGGRPIAPPVVTTRYLIATLGREFIMYAPSHQVAIDRFEVWRVTELPWAPRTISIPGRTDQTFHVLENGSIWREAA